MRVTRWAALVGLLAGVAMAQDKKDDLPPPPAASAVVVPSWTMSTPSGNRRRAGHDVLIYSGASIDVRELDLRTDDGFDVVDLYADNLWTTNYRSSIGLWNPGLPAMIGASWNRAAFVSDPLAGGRSSSRSQTGLVARVRPWPNWRARVAYDTDTLGIPALQRTANLGYQARDLNASLDLPLGPGILSAEMAQLDFAERSAGGRPSASHHWGFGYQAALGKTWAVGAKLNWAKVRQPAVASADLFTMGLSGTYQPLSSFWAEGRLHVRDLNLGATRNGYVTNSTGGGLQLGWRPWQPVRFQTGFDYSGLDRLDAVQAVVEHPTETRFWARLDYRGPSSLRLVGKYELRSYGGIRPSAAPAIGQPAALFFDSEHKLDLRASAMVGQGGLAYGFWNRRWRDNDSRAINETLDNAGVGVSYPVVSQLTLGGDIYYRSVQANQAVLANLDADSLVLHLGANWTPHPRWRVWADFHHAETYFGEDADRSFVAAGVSAGLGGGRSLVVGFNREDYQNTAFRALDYALDVLNVSYVAPF